MADKRSKKPPPNEHTQPTLEEYLDPRTQDAAIAQMHNTQEKKMPLKVNFANVGQVLPPSIYTAQLTEVKVGQAKSSGADMVTMKFAIKDDEEFENRSIYRNFMVDGNALFYLMDALVALGADPEELAGTEEDPEVDIEAIAKRCIGARVRLHLGIRTYEQNGVTKESNDVTKIESI